MQAIGEAIGWDGFRLFGLDPATLLVNRLLAASENDVEARLEWLREVYLAIPTPYAELPELARRGLRSVAFQEQQDRCWGYPPELLAHIAPKEHYRHYHEWRSPVGGTLLAILRHGNEPVAALQAYRRDPKRQFRASDVAFVHAMSARMGAALAQAMAHEVAGAPITDASPASGVLILNAHGGIHHATPAGQRWLEALGGQESGLPPAMWSVLAARRTVDADDAVAITVPTLAGKVRVEASDGGDGTTAIVIAPVRPVSAVSIPAVWGLTPQEALVVRQLAHGKGNAQIAEALSVSEHTVEWHLRGVFDKLGARTRQEVLAALFHHTFLPGIERDVLAATG